MLLMVTLGLFSILDLEDNFYSFKKNFWAKLTKVQHNRPSGAD